MNHYIKALDKYTSNIVFNSKEYDKLINILNSACKKAEALDIIRNKNVDMYELEMAHTVEAYNEAISNTYNIVSKELDKAEFKFLKETLKL